MWIQNAVAKGEAEGWRAQNRRSNQTALSSQNKCIKLKHTNEEFTSRLIYREERKIASDEKNSIQHANAYRFSSLWI